MGRTVDRLRGDRCMQSMPGCEVNIHIRLSRAIKNSRSRPSRRSCGWRPGSLKPGFTAPHLFSNHHAPRAAPTEHLITLLEKVSCCPRAPYIKAYSAYSVCYRDRPPTSLSEKRIRFKSLYLLRRTSHLRHFDTRICRRLFLTLAGMPEILLHRKLILLS